MGTPCIKDTRYSQRVPLATLFMLVQLVTLFHPRFSDRPRHRLPGDAKARRNGRRPGKADSAWRKFDGDCGTIGSGMKKRTGENVIGAAHNHEVGYRVPLHRALIPENSCFFIDTSHFTALLI